MNKCFKQKDIKEMTSIFRLDRLDNVKYTLKDPLTADVNRQSRSLDFKECNKSGALSYRVLCNSKNSDYSDSNSVNTWFHL